MRFGQRIFLSVRVNDIAREAIVGLEKREQRMKKTMFGLGMIIVLGAAVLYGMWRGGSEPAATVNAPSSASATPVTETSPDINWVNPAIAHNEILSQNKPIYLFIYTDWCGYCKKMERETFRNKDIVRIINENFIPIRINPEKPGEVNFPGKKFTFAELAGSLQVTGYPANFFFAPDATLLGNQPGYVNTRSMEEIVTYVGGGFYKDYSFSEFRDLPDEQKQI
jgi:thioredoxin-related protein